MGDVDFNELTAILIDSARRTFRELIRRFVGERFYAFGLWTEPLYSFVAPTLNTEEALLRSARDYHERSPQIPIGDLACSLRWNPGDFEVHRRSDVTLFDPQLDNAFSHAAKILNDIIRSGGDAEFDEFHSRLDNVLYTSLAALDSEGTFGICDDRNSCIANIWIGDRSDEEAVEAASRLNPAQAVEMYRRQIQRGREIGEEWFRRQRLMGPESASGGS